MNYRLEIAIFVIDGKYTNVSSVRFYWLTNESSFFSFRSRRHRRRCSEILSEIVKFPFPYYSCHLDRHAWDEKKYPTSISTTIVEWCKWRSKEFFFVKSDRDSFDFLEKTRCSTASGRARIFKTLSTHLSNCTKDSPVSSFWYLGTEKVPLVFLFSHILRHVLPPRPPRVLNVTDMAVGENHRETDDPVQKLSVTITDGNNHRPHKSAGFASVMPSVSSIRELISYVPTLHNLATRGHLTGIPYLGDKFDDDDQQIINSISDDSNKHSQTMRSKTISFFAVDSSLHGNHFHLIREETRRSILIGCLSNSAIEFGMELLFQRANHRCDHS